VPPSSIAHRFSRRNQEILFVRRESGTIPLQTAALVKRVIRGVLAALVAACVVPATASADDGFSVNQAIVAPANAAIKQALDAGRAERSAAARVKQTAQARPIGEQEPPARAPGLPKGLQYTLDVSSATALGDTGYKTSNLPGGVDAVLAYGLSRYVRAYAGYFQLQEYPLGFDRGVVPVYLQGATMPVAHQDLHQEQVDVTTKDKFAIALLQNLVVLGRHSSLPVPVIVSPGYIARSADVGGNSDVQMVEINGFPQTVHLRSEEVKLVAFTVPLVSSPRMFVSYTAAPQWLVNTSGANQTNHMQLLQVFYAEYRLKGGTTAFIEPSRAANYLPPDQYPQHLASWIYGIAHSINSWAFVEGVVSTGTPTNVPQLGIKSVTCQMLPCAPSQVAPSLGGLRATQVQLMVGVGKPTVIPL
jgi:hypothetical protein